MLKASFVTVIVYSVVLGSSVPLIVSLSITKYKFVPFVCLHA